jgi:hypothetical protein
VANGEVEDYRVSIIPDRERCDLGCEGREYWLTFPGNYDPDPDNRVELTLCIDGAPGTLVDVKCPDPGSRHQPNNPRDAHRSGFAAGRGGPGRSE